MDELLARKAHLAIHDVKISGLSSSFSAEESPALDQIYHIIAFAELQKGEIGKIETRIKQEIDRLDTEHEVQQEINDFWG